MSATDVLAGGALALGSSLATAYLQGRTARERLTQEVRQSDARLAHERRQLWLGLAAEAYAQCGAAVESLTLMSAVGSALRQAGGGESTDDDGDAAAALADRLQGDLHKVAVLCLEPSLAQAAEDVAALLTRLTFAWRSYRALSRAADTRNASGQPVPSALETMLSKREREIETLQASLVGRLLEEDDLHRYGGEIPKLRDAIRAAQA